MMTVRVTRTALVVLMLAGPVARSEAQQSSDPVDGKAECPSRSQASAEPSGVDARFSGNVEVVAVDTVVTAGADFVPDLNPEDFLILEDNVPRPVAVFAAESQTPLAVSLLIDRSRSMAGSRLEAAKTAASAFLASLGHDDMAEVLAFNQRVSLLAPLTAEPSPDLSAMDELSADGMTGLFEAVLVGLQGLDQAQRTWTGDRLKALVILSDGDDNSSVVDFEAVLDVARRSGAMIYAISLASDDRQHWLPPSHELVKLARETGGRVMSVKSGADLTSIYQEIAAEMRHVYRLGFVPGPGASDGTWHTLSVRVPGRDLHVRARAGYFAPTCGAEGPR